ncbi:nucleotidyltransferase domain-containing protein [Thermosediminibacter oceani]|uniref:DNA polymerase beta domain protein region n=1 Tax=Thermosediminibacter oceani (strain ATCC BAA-1034 / DSM 16646 / JW/IW-1228P) TaxID=555079 RepID=D9S0L6_THEOJ|nr:nucleotidyltransferase domain-containing protein [Thermosediminibacter oceani]ADL08874.1 DNA polymerase beta domain protein region [Thermosediminibacter oceani DSM 16646]
MPLDLIQIDREKLKIYIEEKLGQFDEIAGVYLFGSAIDKMRPDSDIDLGIILVPGAVKSEKELALFLEKLYLALRNFDGHPFDLISVRHVNTILAFEILRHGVPLLIKNDEVVSEVIESISRRYRDVYPRYKKALQIITGVSI